MTPDEKILAHAFSTGEPGGFDRLYDLYSPRIFRFCLRICGNRADAEDLTQEVFVAAFTGSNRFESRSSIATWLYRIAIYRRSYMRRLKEPETVSIDDFEVGLVTTNCDSGLERVAIDNAIAALPFDQRMAFLLVKEEQLLCREAAEALQIPESTLKSRLHAAVITLRRLLSADTASMCGPPAPQVATGVRELTNEL
jgi:RNA polymerase sigma-70 factor (ECF subfamily)